MKKLIIISILFFVYHDAVFSQKDYTKYVNPFIGTAEHGHTYPGAALPFGMIQLSPDTGIEGWDWCSGYHATDNSIIGFSHTHLSGTGVGDYGDILIMPFTGEVKFNSGSKANPGEGYRSRFNSEKEKAVPGYYSVFLEDYKINVELTAAKRAGFHKYSYSSEEANLMIDLFHGLQDATIESHINIIDENKIEGYRTSSGWAKRHTVYFYAEFSEDISNYIIEVDNNRTEDKSAEGRSVKASLKFDLSNNGLLLTKIGISHVSLEGAKKNLNAEIPHWDFDKSRNEANAEWNKLLSRIEVEGGSDDQKISYYTALYHTFLAPYLFSDVDQKYVGMDGKVKIADGFNMYTVFSLWDTFRALHPLLTILDEELTTDLIKSLIAKYEESGVLPVWELAANETWTMIGYHSIPVIVDAYMKGIRNFDIDKAYEAMVSSAMRDERGLEYYKEMGFIPMDKADDAVSTTLEYAYDDWCIAVMAEQLGKEEDYKYFMSRAKNYRNVFDNETKFMRGRYNSGFWKENFDPIAPSFLGSGEFTEGNSWQYTWFVPQDVTGLIDLMGGDKLFKEKLDSLFTVETDKEKYHMPSDVTGLIGQYAQGNEPSHHISYLYNYCGYPWSTQYITRKIMDQFFHSGRDGLCGNEDCGQMSAWYALSALGFYPVLPGSNEYSIGSTIFDKVTIHLNNGKDFTIAANNNSSENKYINSAKLNGKEYRKTYFTHNDILSGSNIEYEMSAEPNKQFGVEKEDRPNSKICDEFKTNVYNKNFVPIISPRRTLFANSIKAELTAYGSDIEIRYTLDGSEPTEKSQKYIKPIIQNDSFTLKAKVFGGGLQPSKTIEKLFKKSIVHDKADPFFEKDGIIYPRVLKNENFHPKYNAGGENGIIDGNFASTDFREPFWQGYEGVDCDIQIDLGKVLELNKISANFFERQDSWIFLPKKVTVSFSKDGLEFSEPVVICENEVIENHEAEIKTFIEELKNVQARYINFNAENVAVCPPFHKGAGGNAWIFIDEIIME
ncbi:MAG: GH92 family glycosyl hydrolase [Bacteroidota bacterium]